MSARQWLRLLRDGTPVYAAQPYRQLVAEYRALGDDRQAREVLMAQRDEQLARADTSRPDRAWGRITRTTLGYGYQPLAALLFLAAVLALSCLLTVIPGQHGALTQATSTAVHAPGLHDDPEGEPRVDLNLPVGTTLARAGCGLASRHGMGAATNGLGVHGGVRRRGSLARPAKPDRHRGLAAGPGDTAGYHPLPGEGLSGEPLPLRRSGQGARLDLAMIVQGFVVDGLQPGRSHETRYKRPYLHQIAMQAAEYYSCLGRTSK